MAEYKIEITRDQDICFYYATIDKLGLPYIMITIYNEDIVVLSRIAHAIVNTLHQLDKEQNDG